MVHASSELFFWYGAERLIKQGAVEWDGTRIMDPAYSYPDAPGDHTLRVGKKPAITVRVEPPVSKEE